MAKIQLVIFFLRKIQLVVGFVQLEHLGPFFTYETSKRSNRTHPSSWKPTHSNFKGQDYMVVPKKPITETNPMNLICIQ